mmetsp:Transcript_20809/g.52811  ORF Transcript_20809/g.52811 Transcript_20809/m.52811 type:complete len:220 (+) Transcript_20809:261-920(+)
MYRMKASLVGAFPSTAASSSTRSNFLMGNPFSGIAACATATSAGAMLPNSRITLPASSASRQRTGSTELNASSSSRLSSTEAEEVVATTKSLPRVGARRMQTSNVCSTRLEKRGPMRAYSMSRSKSSSTTHERGDLSASSKVRAIAALLEPSLIPTYRSGETSFTNGQAERSARCAASAVLPAPGGPSSRMAMRLTRCEPCSCFMNESAVAVKCRSEGP